ISVYAAIYVAQGMVNYLMLKLALQSLVGPEGIGKKISSYFDVRLYCAVESFLFAIRENLGANLSAALQNSHDHDLVIGVAALSGDSASLYILVHVSRFS